MTLSTTIILHGNYISFSLSTLNEINKASACSANCSTTYICYNRTEYKTRSLSGHELPLPRAAGRNLGSHSVDNSARRPWPGKPPVACIVSAEVSAAVAGHDSGLRAALSAPPGPAPAPRSLPPGESPGGDSAGPEVWLAKPAGQRG